MSALPPKADIRPRDQDVCFGPITEVTSLLDHLVSGHLQRQRQLEAECLGRLEVDDELEFRRLLYRKVGWCFAFEDAVYIGGSTFELVDAVNTIRDQPAVLSKRKLAV